MLHQRMKRFLQDHCHHLIPPKEPLESTPRGPQKNGNINNFAVDCSSVHGGKSSLFSAKVTNAGVVLKVFE